jgi:DNA methylase/ParB-like nuclease family protein
MLEYTKITVRGEREPVAIFNGEIHPVAELFPMMADDELADLAADIREHGQLQPITLDKDSKLLDGRNRLKCCQLAGVEPVFTTYNGDDPTGYAVSLNVRRRHLTAGQRAMVGLAVEAIYAAEAAKNVGGRPRKGEEKPVADPPPVFKSRERAARAVGASGRGIQAAKRIQQAAPDLAEKVREGGLALDRAERIIRNTQAQERTQQRTAAAEQAVTAGPRWEVRHGDFRTVMDLGPGSAHAVITDPPYAREYLPLLADLARWADYVLVPDGVLVVLYGQTWLPDAYAALSGFRSYRWTGCYQAPGDGYVSMNRRVTSQWKPVLVYGGGPRFMDVFRSDGARRPGKEHHEWAAEISAVTEMVDRLSEPGQVVADPMCGSGTTLLAAQALGRHAVGCDVDLAAVETTRHRLATS